MFIPRENILKTLRREGFESVPVDFVLCKSQMEDFEKRFGHKDFETYFGLCHRSFEMNVQRNYKFGPDQFKREVLPESTVFDEYGINEWTESDAVDKFLALNKLSLEYTNYFSPSAYLTKAAG